MRKLSVLFFIVFIFILTGCNIGSNKFDVLNTKLEEFDTKINNSNYLSIKFDIEVNDQKVSQMMKAKKDPMYLEITSLNNDQLLMLEDNKIFQYTLNGTKSYDREYICSLDEYKDTGNITGDTAFIETSFNQNKCNITSINNKFIIRCNYEDILNDESKEILESIYQELNIPIDILYKSELKIQYVFSDSELNMDFIMKIDYEKLPEPIDLKLSFEIALNEFTLKDMLSGGYKISEPDCFEEIYKTYDYKKTFKIDNYKKVYLKIEAQKGMIIGEGNELNLELYNENYQLINKSLFQNDDSVGPKYSLLPIEEPGTYYVVVDNRYHQTQYVDLIFKQYDTVVSEEGIDLSNVTSLKGKIDGKYDLEKLVYTNDGTNNKSIRIKNLSQEDLILYNFYEINYDNGLDDAYEKFITIKPNEIRYITASPGINEYYICQDFNSKFDLGEYEYNIDISIANFGISDNTIESTIPTEFTMSSHTESFFYTQVEKGLYSITNKQGYISSQEIIIYDANGNKLDANIVEYSDRLEDYAAYFVIPEDGWYCIGVRNRDSFAATMVFTKHDYDTISDKNNPTTLDINKTYEGTLEGGYDFEFYQLQNSSNELNVYCLTNESNNKYSVILKEYPSAYQNIFEVNPKESFYFSSNPGNTEIMIIQNYRFVEDKEIEYKFKITQLENNNVTTITSPDVKELSNEFSEYYYMAGLDLPKPYMKFTLNERGAVQFEYLDYFTNEISVDALSERIYDSTGKPVYDNVLEAGEYYVGFFCPNSSITFSYAKIKYNFYSTKDKNIQVTLKELDYSYNDYKYSYLYNQKITNDQVVEYHFTLTEKSTILYDYTKIQIYDTKENLQVLIPIRSLNHDVNMLYVDLEAGDYYFVTPNMRGNPTIQSNYETLIKIGIKYIERDTPQDFSNMKVLNLDEEQVLQRNYNLDIEYLKFTALEETSYLFDIQEGPYYVIGEICYIFTEDKEYYATMDTQYGNSILLKEGTYYFVFDYVEYNTYNITVKITKE